MKARQFSACVLCVGISFLAACSAHSITLSEKRFCGYQHSDDFVATTEGTLLSEFPWLAALIYEFIGEGTKAVLCSGVLINPKYVLTAAQCLTHPTETLLVGVRLGEYSLKNATDCVGSTKTQDAECSEATDFGIQEKIIHPEYSRQTRVNDIALLRLDSRITEFSDYIRPICLFPAGPIYANPGDTLYTSGWGRKSYNADPADIKKRVRTTLITNEECAKEFISININENHICTNDVPSNSEFTCRGDAGAPVMFPVGSLRQWHLEGISSWGGRCGATRPRVHTRVSKYLKWIEDNVRP